jgi:alpha-ketoglutarate-dependent taurine dioxygenase
MADLEIRPLRPDFGAVVTGVEPTAPLPPDIRRRLKAAFDTRGLLLFPELGVEARFQTWLAEMLAGDDGVDPDRIQVHEKFQVSNYNENSAAPFGRLLFHHESMWAEDACKVASLYGKEVEQPSVPTLFVSAENAWNTLPADLRARVEGRFALHCQDATSQRRRNTSDVLTVTFPVKELLRLPIGYRHPRNGQTVLYVCPLGTHHIEGMDDEEGETLLEALFDHLYAEENVYAHPWREGDLAIWDNVTVQHGRPNVEFKGQVRILRKTMTPMPSAAQTGRPTYATVGM